MANEILPPITAGIHPEKFSDSLVFARDPRVAAVLVVLLIALAFGLRFGDLASESLGEDELNKLQTVEEYRTNGLSGKNGEHPFLMKGLQTVSIVGAEKVSSLTGSPIAEEAALRFPLVLFGSFTVLLIFLLVSELFGRSIGLVSAALWAVEPMAIGFDRVAKEDSLVLFFFLLTNLFWVRSQTEAERGNPNWRRYAWFTAASFAALMASKYYPFFLAVTGAYYIIYRSIPDKKWDMKGVPWIKFLMIMAVSFLILNPTIMLPDTWREMLKFSSENRIGHDSYEFWGGLYRNQMSAFFAGVPWVFYFVFAAVKTSLSTLVLFVSGLPLLFRRKLGDGRFFIFFWGFFWIISYVFVGGKFTRYFTNAAPILFIGAAVAFCAIVIWLSSKLPSRSLASLLQIVLFVGLLAVPISNSLSATPHFRLFTNLLGGGSVAAGSYFPHDEFYDLSTRDIMAEISKSPKIGAIVACETPALFEHYARRAGRSDLRIISLSDKNEVAKLSAGDIVIVAGGRRYFSNTAYLEALKSRQEIEIKAGNTVSARIYTLDQTTAETLIAIAKGKS